MMVNNRNLQGDSQAKQQNLENRLKSTFKISSAIVIVTSAFWGISALGIDHLSPVQKRYFLQPIESLKAQTNSSSNSRISEVEGTVEVLVAEVVIQGVDDAQLRDNIYNILTTKPGQTTSSQQLQEDINQIVALGWFRNVRAVRHNTPLGLRITFEVEVNPILRSIRVIGNQVLTPQIVKQIFQKQFNHRINLNEIETGIKNINTWYKDNGYVIAQVIAAPEVGADGVVTLTVAEGIIEDILFQFIQEGSNIDATPIAIQDLDERFPFPKVIQSKVGEAFNQKIAQKELSSISKNQEVHVHLRIEPGVKNPRHAIVIYKIFIKEDIQTWLLKYEAKQLEKQNNADSQQKAIEKYEELNQAYAQQGDRFRQATTLRKIAELEAKKVDAIINENKSLSSQVLVPSKISIQPHNPLILDSSSLSQALIQSGNNTAQDNSQSATVIQLPTPESLKQSQTPPSDLLGLSTLIPSASPESQLEKVLQYKKKKNQQQDKTLKPLRESLKTFQEINHQWGEVLQLYQIGYLHRKWQEPELALEYFNQALERSKTLEASQASWMEVAILNEMGLTFEELDDTKKSLEIYQTLLSKLQKNQSENIKISGLLFRYNFGFKRQKASNQSQILYSAHLDFLPEGISTADNNQKQVEGALIGITLMKMGQAYRHLDDQAAKTALFQESLTIFQQQVQLSLQIGDPKWTGIFLSMAAFGALELDDAQKSLAQIQEIVNLTKAANQPEWGASLLLFFAGVQTYIRQEDREQVLPILEEVLSLIPQVQQPEWKSGLGIVAAWLYMTFDEPTKAKSLLTLVLPELEQVKKLEFSIPLRLALAGVYQKLGEKQQTLFILSQLSSEINRIKKPEISSVLLMGLAWLYSELGNPQLASDIAEQAFDQINTLNQPFVKIALLTGWAWVMEKNFDEQEAITALQQAVREIRQQPNSSQVQTEMQFMVLVPEFLVMFKQPQLAIPFYEEIALYHQEQLNNPTQATQFFEKIPDTYRRMGKPRLAIEKYQTVTTAYRQLGKIKEATSALFKLGKSYQDIGEYQQAIQSFNEAGELLQNSADQQEAPLIYQEIGRFYGSLGDPQQAQFYYKRAKELAQKLGNTAQMVDILVDVGDWHLRWGEAQQALKAYQQALELLSQLSESNRSLLPQWQETFQAFLSKGEWTKLQQLVTDSQSQAVIQAKMSLAYSDLDKKSEAIAAFQQAVKLAQSANWQVKRQMFIQGAILYERLEEPQQAIYFLEKAQVDSKAFLSALDDSPEDATLLTFLGKLNAQVGKIQEALDYYNQALELAKEIGNPALESDALYRIAEVEHNAKDFVSAQKRLETALQIVEALRTQIGDLGLRASYFATVQDYYDLYIDVLMQLHQANPTQGYDVQALHASERAKARTLLELLALANTNIRQGVDPQLLEEKRSLQQQFQSLEEHRLHLLAEKADLEQIKALEQHQEEVLQQYRELQTKLQATPNRYANLTQPQPLTLKEIQEQVLDDQTVLLQYALGKEHSYVWVVTKTSITTYQLSGRQEIETSARNMILGLTAPKNRIRLNHLATVGNRLTALLLNPVRHHLENKRLLIVGDGILHYVPFSALPIPQTSDLETDYQPLIVQHEVVNLPSASTLAVLRQETATRPIASKTVAILADPVFSPDDERVKSKNTQPLGDAAEALQNISRAARDLGVSWERLIGTRREAETIMGLVNETQRTQVLDFQANREQATSSQLADYRIIHWATHGFVNSRNPELSGIVMSLVDEQGNWQNGYLRLNDIYNLNFPADLVVLSACQTGLGKNIRGEGLVGLTRGFMYAGTPRVVASLWKVNDAATAELMSKFYQAMLSQGLAPSAALRVAQLEMWQTSDWRSPYYWAAFTLQGEWLPFQQRLNF